MDAKTTVKQFWCSHIWENIKEKDLNRMTGDVEYDIFGWVGKWVGKKHCFAVYQTCTKCDKERIIETVRDKK